VPWLREHARGFDAIVVNGIWQYTSFGTWRALRKEPVPHFVFTHGMLDPWFKLHYPLKHLKKWLYWPWGEYRVLRDARAVMFTCEEERRLARDSFFLYKVNECVVNYGTARPEGNPDRQRESFLSQFPGLRGKRILLFLSRIHEKKGCDLLIKAFGALSTPNVERPASSAAQLSLNSSLHLVIAGPCADSAYLDSLRRLASDCCPPNSVSFTEMLSGDLKWGAFHAADAFILPSHQENFGIAVAEALACGLPVLISNKVNIWREIEQDGGGLVAEDTLEGTRDLLEQWLRLSPQQQERMRTSALDCFNQRFEIGRAADSLYEALFRMTRKDGADTHV
jgi:glycosyltransferase involved in cell wall biosynthesis